MRNTLKISSMSIWTSNHTPTWFENRWCFLAYAHVQQSPNYDGLIQYAIPSLDCGSDVRSPATKKLKNKIEKVGHIFTKILIYNIRDPHYPHTSLFTRE